MIHGVASNTSNSNANCASGITCCRNTYSAKTVTATMRPLRMLSGSARYSNGAPATHVLP
jgi:hypothetical protein